MQLPNLKSAKGFTLIELIVVIGMLTILFAIVLVAVNPGRQFAASRNTARSNDVNAILNAVHQYAADHNGTLPAGIPTSPTVVDVGNITGSSPAMADLCSLLSPTYISALPQDPSSNNGASITTCSAQYDTHYQISKDSNNRVTVSAPSAENSATISVTR